MVMIKELRSDIKIGKFYIKDIAFVGGYFLIFYFLRSFVSSAVLIPYLIFNFFCCGIACNAVGVESRQANVAIYSFCFSKRQKNI